jgi:hypothetical protein
MQYEGGKKEHWKARKRSVPSIFSSFLINLFTYLFTSGVALLKKVLYLSWALVAHTCSPSYSGGRDQEDLIQM